MARREYIAAAQARGWHFADACMQLGKKPTPQKFSAMLNSALEYAKDTAFKNSEAFNKEDATVAFQGAFTDHPRVP